MRLLISFLLLSLVTSRGVSSVGASNDSRLLRRKADDQSTRSLIQQQQQQEPTKFFLCSKGITETYCRIDHATCEIEPDTGKSMCRCLDGLAGRNCDEDVNECAQTPYPCAGGTGTKEGFFCVNYNPPERYKCGCRQGYQAVLPDKAEMLDPVPVEWRPIKCIPTDKCLEAPSACHVNATCTSSPTAEDGFVCTCNEDLEGDGVTTCTLPTTKPKAVINSNNNNNNNSSKSNNACTSDADCATTLVNSMCVDNVCSCKTGFYRSSGRGQCLNTDECSADDLNDCHRDATCEDTVGSYQCKCKDGYQDWNSELPPGRNCAQINECLDPTRNDCNSDTHVCLDRPPPTKWECVARTPAPTPFPTPSPTLTQQEYDCRSAGFKSVGLCIGCTFLKLKSKDCESETYVSLAFNGLTGRIPSELGKLTNLKYLNLYKTKLTGPIPSELGKLTNLGYLNLSENELKGAIPSELGKLDSLKYLFLYKNQLTGTVPKEVKGLGCYTFSGVIVGNDDLTERR